MSNTTHNNKEHTFNKMREYMFYEENMNKWTRFLENKVEKKFKSRSSKKYTSKQKKKETFSPKQRDQLFWIFFVMLKGMDEYFMIQHNIFTVETDFKFKTIEMFRKKKKEMKALKMKVVDIEDNLVNGKTINVKTLQALCFVYEKSVIYKQDNMYYDFNYGGKYVLIEKEERDIVMHLDVEESTIISIKEKKFYVDVNKPIRGISYYNITDIHIIASKLAIKNNDEKNKAKTKKVLYQEIIQMLEKLR